MSESNPHNVLTTLVDRIVAIYKPDVAAMTADVIPADRAERIAFLSAWRAAYAAMSEDIREQKRLRRVGDDEFRSRAQGRREFLRSRARAMMTIRMEYKRIARSGMAEAA